MDQIPKNFLTACKIMGFPDDKANDAWLNIWEKASQDFVVWLAKAPEIPEEQRIKVSEKFAAHDPASQETVLSLALQALDEPHGDTAINKFADFLLTNLDKFYTSSFDHLTVEQRQAVNSFLSIAHE